MEAESEENRDCSRYQKDNDREFFISLKAGILERDPGGPGIIAFQDKAWLVHVGRRRGRVGTRLAKLYRASRYLRVDRRFFPRTASSAASLSAFPWKFTRSSTVLKTTVWREITRLKRNGRLSRFNSVDYIMRVLIERGKLFYSISIEIVVTRYAREQSCITSYGI